MSAGTSATALRAYYFLLLAAMGVLLPFLPAWLDARGVSGWGIGVISAMRPLSGVLMPVVFGLLADVLRLRGSLLRFACGGAVTAMGLIALSVGISSPGLVVLSVLFGVLAVFWTPMGTLADVAALESNVPFGRLRLWGSLGFLLAALTAGYVVDPKQALSLPIAILVLLGGAFGVAFLLSPRAEIPPQPVWSAARALFAGAEFRLFLFGGFLWAGSHSAYDISVSLHLEDLGASNGFIGWAWSIATLAEVGLMAICASWIDRHGPTRMMLVGVSIGVLRWLLLAHVRSLDLMLALQPLHAGSFGLVFVAATSYVRERAEPHVLATAQASFAVVTGIGGVLGMLVWGPLFEASGGSALFKCAAGVAVASALALVVLVAAQRQRRPAPGVQGD